MKALGPISITAARCAASWAIVASALSRTIARHATQRAAVMESRL